MSTATAPTDTTAALLIEKEIRATVMALANDVVTRRDHPSYGIRKTDMLRRLHQLEGLLYAWTVAADYERSAHFDAQVAQAAGYLGIGLSRLRTRVHNA